MSRQQEDKLENLRMRATCPICREFYEHPKRLKCSHVYCLKCLKYHLQSMRSVNFPPCPMCRRPILYPLSEIDEIEPARAEIDIRDYLKDFEICGLCGQKNNPKLQCSDCDRLICDSCKPCHNALQSSHVLEPIRCVGAHRSSDTRRSCIMCKEHPGQIRDLFCIICCMLLCSHCRDFSHEICTDKNDNFHVYKRFSRGFLQDFVQAKADRILLYNKVTLPRVVYITEFVKEAKNWLNRIEPKVKQIVNFFREYNRLLKEAIFESDKHEDLATRCQFIEKNFNERLNSCKDIHTKIVNLSETESDFEVAKSVCALETECLHLFRIRRTLSLDTRLRKLEACSTATSKTVIKQYLNCIKKHDDVFLDLGIMLSPDCFTETGLECTQTGTPSSSTRSCYDDPVDSASTSFVSADAVSTSVRSVKDCDIASASIRSVYNTDAVIYIPIKCTKNEIKQSSVSDNKYFEIKKNLKVEKKKVCTYSSEEWSHFVVTASTDDSLYTNEFLKQSELRSINTCTVHKIDVGYSDVFLSSRKKYFECRFYAYEQEDKSLHIAFSLNREQGGSEALKPELILHTRFVNAFLIPALYGTNGAKSSFSSSRIVGCIGNRHVDSGLETLLLLSEEANEIPFEYAVSIITKCAKFKSTKIIDMDGDGNYQLVADKNGNFSFFSGKCGQRYIATYHSKFTDISESSKFIECFEIKSSQHTDSHVSVNIPVTFLKSDLLCSLKQGIYYTYFEDKANILKIQKLEFIGAGPKESSIKWVTEADVGIPVCKLRPLTMLENLNEELVVVCAVSGKITNLVVIFPYKKGKGGIEFVEVCYPQPEMTGSDVVDLEMSPAGDIIYVLKSNASDSCSIYTKYIMPP